MVKSAGFSSRELRFDFSSHLGAPHLYWSSRGSDAQASTRYIHGVLRQTSRQNNLSYNNKIVVVVVVRYFLNK